MTDRERFVACVLGEPVDRVPYWLAWGPWETTWRRWCEEGKPAGVIDARMPFEPDFPPIPLPVNCGPCPKFEERILEEDAESRVHVDSWGITRRTFKNKESMPRFLDYPVKSRRDWEQYKEERLDPDHPDRLAPSPMGDWREIGKSLAACGIPLQLGYYPDTGLYGGVRWLMGEVDCLVAFCTDPELVQEIMEHLTTVYLTVFEKVLRELRVDVIHMWEDMCGRQGPLISPQHWDTFLGPHYRRLRAFADAHDIPVFSVDTDGNPDLIIPPMIDAGVNFLFPLEVAAGCDVNKMRAKYPRLGMMGGIDKRALALGPDAIDAELERVRPAVARGRYVPDLDHLVPDDVPWDNYRYFATALKRLTGKG
ncbi:MAG: hypothetical protein KA184_01975 [Candidatus Hydrogenedentes bacterium]|nr:hypothetical protein [Candidatus Hydrogenedentota bacterium]